MMQLALFDDAMLEACQHELSVVDMGKTIKSYCDLMGCWTNCRDWGSCVYDLWKGESDEQIDNQQRA